jgi:hypothetical protein
MDARESLETYLYGWMLNYKSIPRLDVKQQAEIIGVVASGMQWLAETKTASTYEFMCKEYDTALLIVKWKLLVSSRFIFYSLL